MIFMAQITGYMTIIGIIVVVTGLAITATANALRYLVEATHKDIKTETLIFISQRMFQDSYWFSEDPVTADLLRWIATDISIHGWSNVAEVRDKWRQARK